MLSQLCCPGLLSKCPGFAANATPQTELFAAWWVLTSERAVSFKLCHQWTRRALRQVFWFSFAHTARLVVALVAELPGVTVCELQSNNGYVGSVSTVLKWDNAHRRIQRQNHNRTMHVHEWSQSRTKRRRSSKIGTCIPKIRDRVFRTQLRRPTAAGMTDISILLA